MMKQGMYLVLFLLLVVSGCQPPETISEKPNIVFIFTDDQTYDAVHALGNEDIITPNMDRLVKEGTTFTHAYNMGAWNGAVCAASRTQMVSGRSVWRVNQFREQWKNGDSLDMTWGRLMKQAGYDTYMTGKWHVDAPASKVFDISVDVRPGMPKDHWDHAKMVEQFAELVDKGLKASEEVMPLGYNRPQNAEDTAWRPDDPAMGGYWAGGRHWSEVLKEDALGFIDQATQKDNPFFMYLAFNAPHDPRQAPTAYQEMYEVEDITLPESWVPVYPYQDLIGNGPSLRDEALAPFPRTEFATKTHIKEYYALISHLDDQIGQILDALEASGKMENTYIFFTADHGLAMGRHGLIGKQSLYDHSVRPPFMVVGPDVPQGRQIDTDIYLQDVMASALDLAGIEKPSYVEFNSVMPLISGKQVQSNYESIYGAYVDKQRSIRKDGYKLVAYPKAAKLLLFDLNNDPEEMTNLADTPEYEGKVASLFDELLVLQAHYDDPLDIRGMRP
ncbi:sulfatase-like hydrolase/transferase [Reichenbachiella agariperforans]|uniref:sulfatase-like hydrolase/transferase n=1 Tax=Reichenbachiella agariperforans TaxID=156994 RepID=UPI001C0A339D|nr:sulfatase-like hydrolase/transferase [Reichenbachiella agariperforans]MBU2912639.1 sulfatase-like hydrolase/transferase [Reichenbachiella agariperforans]